MGLYFNSYNSNQYISTLNISSNKQKYNQNLSNAKHFDDAKEVQKVLKCIGLKKKYPLISHSILL